MHKYFLFGWPLLKESFSGWLLHEDLPSGIANGRHYTDIICLWPLQLVHLFIPLEDSICREITTLKLSS